MLLPKGGVGVTWKSARARLPPWRALVVLLTRTRFLITIAVTGLVILLWRGISKSAAEMQKYVPFRFFLSVFPSVWLGSSRDREDGSCEGLNRY